MVVPIGQGLLASFNPVTALFTMAALEPEFSWLRADTETERFELLIVVELVKELELVPPQLEKIASAPKKIEQ